MPLCSRCLLLLRRIPRPCCGGVFSTILLRQLSLFCRRRQLSLLVVVTHAALFADLMPSVLPASRIIACHHVILIARLCRSGSRHHRIVVCMHAGIHRAATGRATCHRGGSPHSRPRSAHAGIRGAIASRRAVDGCAAGGGGARRGGRLGCRGALIGVERPRRHLKIPACLHCLGKDLGAGACAREGQSLKLAASRTGPPIHPPGPALARHGVHAAAGQRSNPRACRLWRATMRSVFQL